MADDTNHDIELVDLINSLRTQMTNLNKQVQEGDVDVAFEVENLEVELCVKSTKSVEAGGKSKVRFWVVDGEASAKAAGASESTQKIKLSLKPKAKDGNGDGSFEIGYEGATPNGLD
ncbi:MAG: trypco2 family protein [Pontibacterium sp.]